jgi:DNA-directed RNA polymerase specialized sigma24 family protein
VRGLTSPIATRTGCEDRVFESRITVAVDLLFLFTTEKPCEGLRTVAVKSEQEQPAIFAARFFRAYRLLDFIARRVLCDKKRAQIAIHNCWQTASRNPPRFQYEGAFRSWLVRVLINQALTILRESQGERDAAAADVNVVSVSDRTVKPGPG